MTDSTNIFCVDKEATLRQEMLRVWQLIDTLRLLHLTLILGTHCYFQPITLLIRPAAPSAGHFALVITTIVTLPMLSEAHHSGGAFRSCLWICYD